MNNDLSHLAICLGKVIGSTTRLGRLAHTTDEELWRAVSAANAENIRDVFAALTDVELTIRGLHDEIRKLKSVQKLENVSID